MATERARPTKGPIGNTYSTPGPEVRFGELNNLAQSQRLSPAEARRKLEELITSIPDTELENFIGAQITLVA